MHMYIDLRPTDAKPTHRRKVWQDSATMPTDLPDNRLAFTCLGQAKGIIAFLPFYL